MPRELTVEPRQKQSAKAFKCPSCFDYGIVLLVERVIIGVTDLVANSMPCTCPSGDQWKGEYSK